MKLWPEQAAMMNDFILFASQKFSLIEKIPFQKPPTTKEMAHENAGADLGFFKP